MKTEKNRGRLGSGHLGTLWLNTGGSELSFRDFCDMDVLAKKMFAEEPLLAPGLHATLMVAMEGRNKWNKSLKKMNYQPYNFANKLRNFCNRIKQQLSPTET
jgi:hypothetical protein